MTILQVEYLIILKQEQGFCDTLESLKRYLGVDSRLKFIHSKTLSFSDDSKNDILVNFHLEMEEIPQERVFHAKFSCEDNNQDPTEVKATLNLFKQFLRIFRTLIRKLEPIVFQKIEDSISRFYAEKSYPLVNKIENLWRKLILKVLVYNLGSNWINEVLPDKLKKNLNFKTASNDKSTKISHDFLYQIDFIDLAKFLTTPYGFDSPEDFYSELDAFDENVIDVSYLRSITKPKSNWERFFWQLIEYDEARFLKQWKELYRLRCKVAHSDIDFQEYEKVEAIFEELSVVVNNALKRVSRTVIPEKEKEEIKQNLSIFMERNAIKTFATWARRHLREQVTARLDQFGITVKGIEEAKPVSGGLTVAGQVLDAEDAQRYQRLRTHLDDLQRQEKTLKGAVERLIDEIAYTWFNRLAALRFMEVNGYLNQRVVSSSDPNLVDPDLLRDTGSIAELETLPGLTLDTLAAWRDLASRTPNPDETLYRQLLGVQCRALSESLPFLFDPQQDYLTLFLPGNLLNQDSIIRRLANDIPEEDWRDSADSENGVEIIGWLYQFYISERKDEVIGAKSKIAARDIPAATQLFTPHWIVRYMVENSLGRLWLESYPESGLRSVMKYYLESPPEEAPHPLPPSPTVGEGEPETVPAPLARSGRGDGGEGIPTQPQELTVLDPACGSGHILVYAFDLLFEIYKEQGYRERDIPALILEHNLHGLDIDERAVQLARFAVLMKARAKNPRFFRKPEQIPRLKIMTVKSTRPLLAGRQVKVQAFPSQQAAQLDLLPNTEPEQLDLATVAPAGADAGIFSLPQLKREDWLPLLEAFKDADNLGSLITPPKFDAKKLLDQVQKLREENPLFAADAAVLEELLEQAEMLRRQYWVVVANPPYMGSKGMNTVLKDFASKNYPKGKSDLFAVSVERILELMLGMGFIGLMTPFTWMFLSSYEKLRINLLNNTTITSLIRPEYHAFFDSAYVPICSFTLKKETLPEYRGTYIDLDDFYGADLQPTKTLEAIVNPDCGYLYYAKSADFEKIPGCTIAYSLSKKVLDIYDSCSPLLDVAFPKKGLNTANNDRFLRFWFEIGFSNLALNTQDKLEAKESKKKWFPNHKGGEYRKWYGNNDWVINWFEDGQEIRDYPSSVVRNPGFYFKESITYSSISSSFFGARFSGQGFLFNTGGSCIFPKESGNFWKLGGFLCSKLAPFFMSSANPTMNINVEDVAALPILEIQESSASTIEEAVLNCFQISKQDWDNFETSWDFQTHPLLRHNTPSLAQAFNIWQQQAEIAFQELKHLEEENNRYWIDAYGLQDELTPEVPDDQITIRRADLQRDIKSLISYAVGCMMGRYSLDKPGLIHAGQPFDPSHHQQFPADADAIIPITDQAYFDDDIVTRFVEFIKVAFSPDTLTENLDFIANALTLKSGETALDRIRRYFVNEFISDHIKTYKKRPIYWLFSSGKKRAFGALVYLHRYTPETVGRIRTDYILELQVKLDKESDRVQAQADSATTTAAKRAATKRLKTLQDQQLELRDYQARVQTFGDQRIALDLDDGVAYNYTRFKGIIYEGTDLKMKDLEKKAQWKLDLLKAQEVPQ